MLFSLPLLEGQAFLFYEILSIYKMTEFRSAQLIVLCYNDLGTDYNFVTFVDRRPGSTIHHNEE